MNIRSFLALCLLTVLMLVSCAPTEAPAPTQPEAAIQPAATMEESSEDPQAIIPSENESESPVASSEMTEEPTVSSEPEFVPRGPNLEATDPTTVSLNSGEYQLVEFFRYT